MSKSIIKKPTDEQITEFWKQLGVSYIQAYDGRTVHITTRSIDLNNLFKYAVPKLQDISQEHYITFQHPYPESDSWIATIHIELHYNYKDFDGQAEDPALALFWAIFEVIKENRNADR